MATKAQLIGKVLDYYRAAGAGQAGSPEDIAKVDGYVASKIDDLNARLGIYIADSDDVPEAQADWLALAIAQVPPLASFFGVAPSPDLNAYAEQMLKAQVADDFSGPVRAVYY